jgi:hypothetical protein
MVVNMGSLTSTVMFVVGAGSCGGRAACGGGGATELTFCAWLEGAGKSKNRLAMMAALSFAERVRADERCREPLRGL